MFPFDNKPHSEPMGPGRPVDFIEPVPAQLLVHFYDTGVAPRPGDGPARQYALGMRLETPDGPIALERPPGALLASPAFALPRDAIFVANRLRLSPATRVDLTRRARDRNRFQFILGEKPYAGGTLDQAMDSFVFNSPLTLPAGQPMVFQVEIQEPMHCAVRFDFAGEWRRRIS